MLPLFLLLACGPKSQLPTTAIQLKDLTLTVEVADTPDERHLGLMHRDSLGEDRGMLFVYPGEAPRSFWMQNTKIPLSIAYIDREGVILNLADMTPMSTQGVPSEGPAMYALEVNQGWYVAHGIQPGDKVQGLPPASER